MFQFIFAVLIGSVAAGIVWRCLMGRAPEALLCWALSPWSLPRATECSTREVTEIRRAETGPHASAQIEPWTPPDSISTIFKRWKKSLHRRPIANCRSISVPLGVRLGVEQLPLRACPAVFLQTGVSQVLPIDSPTGVQVVTIFQNTLNVFHPHSDSLQTYKVGLWTSAYVTNLDGGSTMQIVVLDNNGNAKSSVTVVDDFTDRMTPYNLGTGWTGSYSLNYGDGTGEWLVYWNESPGAIYVINDQSQFLQPYTLSLGTSSVIGVPPPGIMPALPVPVALDAPSGQQIVFEPDRFPASGFETIAILHPRGGAAGLSFYYNVISGGTPYVVNFAGSLNSQLVFVNTSTSDNGIVSVVDDFSKSSNNVNVGNWTSFRPVQIGSTHQMLFFSDNGVYVLSGSGGTSLARTSDNQYANLIYSLQIQLESDPANSTLYTEIGQLYILSGDDVDGEWALLYAIQLDPNDYTAFYVLGQAYTGEGAYAGAAYAFTRAIELQPNNPDAYLALGQMYIQEGDVTDGDYYLWWASTLTNT